MSIFNSIDIISGSLNLFKAGENFASASGYVIRNGIETTGGIKGNILSIVSTNPPTSSNGTSIPLIAAGYSDTTEAPRVGIGTSAPKTLFQIESPSSSLESPDFILTTPSESISVGQETGRMVFAIADTAFSSSGIIASGSTAAIYSKVLGTGVNGSYGSLIFEVNDDTSLTAPIEALTVGYGLGSAGLQVGEAGFVFSGSAKFISNLPSTQYRTRGGVDVAYLGSNLNAPPDPTEGTLKLYKNGNLRIELNSGDQSYISGSLNVTSSFTASGLNYPDVDGVDRQVIKTDGNGNLSFGYPEATTIAVKNVSGGSIPKGTPCYITASGTSGNIAGIIPADASNPNLMPAGIIAGETLADEAEGIGLVNGFIQGVDTSTFTSGDTVYVAVGGGYTNVRPTGSGVLIQKLGNVEKVDNTNGSGIINGPGYYNELPNWETYEFGYEITTAFPVTGSGLIVSSSYLPANHYNMVKIGETELLDINSALTPNTFFIHNVDNFVVASGSEPVNVYGDGPGKLFEHTGDEFKVYAKDELKITIDSGSTTTSNLLVASGRINIKAVEDTGLQYVAGFVASPSASPRELIFVTASTFGGGGSSSTPYSLGTFGGSYNWGTADGGERVAHGFVNGPNAGQTQNSGEWGASIVGTPDSTTYSMATYLMQYHALYCPVGGIPHIKAWGRTSDADFTSAHSMSISLWSLETEPANLAGGNQTLTLRAQSDFLPFNASTVSYQGNGWIASGSSARPEGTFYFVTFDLGGPNPAGTAVLYANFTIWVEPS